MPTSALMVALTLGTLGASIPQRAAETQNATFERYWGTEFVWKFDELPNQGTLPNFRVPYSGYIYPDTQGGTINALSKYDRAFNHGRGLAAGYEKYDTTAFKKPIPKPLGPFGLIAPKVMQTPDWHGHCNGWAAAAIRHAEPQKSVNHNGVTFSPADIKALLAEIYIYNEPAPLAGWDENINAGVLHATIANWIGRGAHPIGMEADPGEEKWNYPAYAYSYSAAKRSSNTVEVKMNLAYAKDSNGEYQESPRIRRLKYFHYQLVLNSAGQIVGGSYYRDSSRIDMLWVPTEPVQGGMKGNERGNRHVSVKQVLAMWRASVPEDVRTKWPVINPATEDQMLVVKDTDKIIPRGFSIVVEREPEVDVETEVTTDEATGEENPAVARATVTDLEEDTDSETTY